MQSTRKREILWGIGLSVALFVLLLFLGGLLPGLPEYVCPLYRFTGLYCPACGGTRMLYLLLLGHWGQAFGMNPPLFLLSPALLYLTAAQILRLLAGRELLPIPSPRPWMVIAAVSVLLLYGILRNIPALAFLNGQGGTLGVFV